MIRNLLLSSLSVALAIVASTVAAQSVHVHGEGRVNIAIEGNQIFMALEFPGADIVGFEHKAHSSDEKAAVAGAIALLGDPMLLMRFDADCKVLHASAGIEGEEHEGEEHDEHEENAENDEHDEHEGEDEHGAFVAAYEFECADIDSLGSIEFTYFNQFDNAQSIEIVLIDGSGQSQVEIDRASPILQLKK